MIVGVVHVKSARPRDINRIISRAVAMMTGAHASPGASWASRGIWQRVGIQALSLVRKAFLLKAAGGTDDCGERWKPLSPATIAYSRRHPGLPPGKERASKRPSYALTDELREEWWGLYGTALRKYKGDKGHAAAVAWVILKQNHGSVTTLMSQYGNTPVEILRDTGALTNSLTPGVVGSKPKDQVFRVQPGAVVVGTNRKWAGVHHEGSKDGRIPQRRLWPAPSRWTSRWWDLLLQQARGGMTDLVKFLLQR